LTAEPRLRQTKLIVLLVLVFVQGWT